MTPLGYQIVVGCLLIALVVAVMAAVVGRRPAAGRSPGSLVTAYSYIKGRWPYILGVTSAVVVELHTQGVLTDSQFKTLLALHAAGIGPALRGAIQHIVGDAIQRKVTVQIKEAQAGRPPVLRPDLPWPGTNPPPHEPLLTPKEGL